MEASRPKPNFKDTILHELKRRHDCEVRPWEGLIRSHNRLLELNDNLKSNNIQLTLELDKLRAENENLKIHGETSSGSSKSDKVSALEQKVFKLQEELTELHRRKGENSELIIQLNSALKLKENELSEARMKISEFESYQRALLTEKSNLEKTILGLEEQIQTIRDEHTSLQLMYNALEQDNRKINIEYQELLNRWLKYKAVQADLVNMQNDAEIKQKQLQMQNLLQQAAEQAVDVVEVDNPRSFPFLPFDGYPTKCVYKWDAHEGEVNAVKFGPTGILVATGGSDRKIKLWNIVNNTCEEAGVLTGCNAAVMSIDIDNDERHIVGGCNDFACRVWSSDRRLRHSLTGHSGKVLAARFVGGEATKVVSGSHDRTLKVWDLISKACIKTIFAGSSCNDLVTAGSMQTTIISGHFDKRIRFWDTRADTPTNEILLQGKITSVDIARDDTLLLACSRDDTIKLIDIRRNLVVSTLCAESFRTAFDWTRAAFSPNGRFVAAGSQDGAVYVWNALNAKLETILKEHSQSVSACTWNRQNMMLVSVDRSKRAVLWGDG